jgi:membrane-bound lytic murein transglycosylase MltF
MKLVPLLAAMTIALAGCSSEAPKPAPASPALKPIDAAAIPSEIRILVALSGLHYHFSDGRAVGQTVNVGTDFEQWINARIAPKKVSVVFIETPEDALIKDLLAGKGNIAANVLLTFERDDQVAFAKPIVTRIREIIITGPKEPPLVSLEDVGQRRISVRKSSDHFASLARLNEQLKKIDRPPARLVIAPETETDLDLIAQVRLGTIPATIAYDYEFDACCGKLAVNVNRDVSVSQDGSLSWVTRKDTPQLLALLNEFFSSYDASTKAP